ncbi:MAG: hypothetical protein A3B25_01315 [Candidatus Ryanbacteria bacterium RIFCSPLOWO2_01_FULL_48_26]|uniref:Uncharacterized protein n=1 Tax=Candidatus Ryanbacteria bacterium RIFCSPLOWO2_01_FULL_48_26 TaxID=1802126 RepID=A0A1G2GU00_9BACT|nr:MAG: hypothetical protein A3B25_01315 [Candidatus Ryanbacteria bacterium RIFCSPLOWO2_01_FULL_48_26]OHB21540.1 MAG: hypothetical protein A3J67_04090 [Parcubacteria group bacterium RIFCSPHIGHO2_02_FULL_48_10b]
MTRGSATLLILETEGFRAFLQGTRGKTAGKYPTGIILHQWRCEHKNKKGFAIGDGIVKYRGLF